MNQISYEERARIYTDAQATLGANVLLIEALEKLSDVQKEICKTIKRGGCSYHLAEKVADTTIMLEQVRLMFGINAEVCKIMDHKVIELKQRTEFAQARQRPDLAAILDLFGKGLEG